MKDDIKIPMASNGIASVPNSIGGEKEKTSPKGANFQYCAADGHNKDTAPEGKTGGPF